MFLGDMLPLCTSTCTVEEWYVSCGCKRLIACINNVRKCHVYDSCPRTEVSPSFYLVIGCKQICHLHDTPHNALQYYLGFAQFKEYYYTEKTSVL